MDTSKLKTFAQAARRDLLDQVGARLEQVLRTDSAEFRQKQKAIDALQSEIKGSSKEDVIERVAYTWFNRFCALRFMDVNYYTPIGIVSPQEGFTQPELLQEAKQGSIGDWLKVDEQRVLDLLSGQAVSSNPQQEAYRHLLVGACNAYHRQMPFLFPEIDDYTELLMPEDLLSESSVLQAVREALTTDACRDVEVIGWLYQFYISEKKDEVFASKGKIQPEDIPAATQLFTPHWIVRYLVENSLGRLWLLNHPDSSIKEQMDYYIEPVEQEEDFLKVDSPEELKICDPACGSGHMLTYAFDLLYAIYEENGYDAAKIPSLIIENNLYGMEISERAGHLASFALMMKGRQKDPQLLERGLEPSICVFRNVIFEEQELSNFMDAIGRDLFTTEFERTLRQFEQAETFGSLIQPAIADPLKVRAEIGRRGISQELFLFNSYQKSLQILKYAEYLLDSYHLVVTNPPYMANRAMCSGLKDFVNTHYQEFAKDLFSVFVIRNLKLTSRGGHLGHMTPYVWMFLSSHEELRNHLIENKTITTFIQLEYSGFAGATVPICAFTLGNFPNPTYPGAYISLSDFVGPKNQAPNALEAIRNPESDWFYRFNSTDFKMIPGSPIAFWVSDRIRSVFERGTPFGKIGNPKVGMQTSNNKKYLRIWHEINYKELSTGDNGKPKWIKYVKGGPFRRWYGNLTFLLFYNKDPEFILQQKNASVLPLDTLAKPKCTWTDVTSYKFSCRYIPKDTFHDISGHCFYPSADDQMWLLGYTNSKVFDHLISIINSSFHFQVGDVAKIPVMPIDKPEVSSAAEKLVQISKRDWDSYEQSWNFFRSPLLNRAVSGRSLGEVYAEVREVWRRNVELMGKLEKKINKLVIHSFGLQEEISPDVDIHEISLTCNPNYRYSSEKPKEKLESHLLGDTIREFISYSVGCMFGRYSLDKPGLILANQGDTFQKYLAQIPEPAFIPDQDNVIPVLEEGWFADDITERFKEFLGVTFGEEHYQENLAFIENAIGRDIRDFFLKDFYDYHCKMYSQPYYGKRPIYWMFSSENGGFNALIYMHRYQPDTVSIILNDYLREFRQKITARLESVKERSVAIGASASEKANAVKELERLQGLLAEIREYEDDVLYPLASEQIEIDLDDGVPTNYAKFGKALREI